MPVPNTHMAMRCIGIIHPNASKPRGLKIAKARMEKPTLAKRTMNVSFLLLSIRSSKVMQFL